MKFQRIQILSIIPPRRDKKSWFVSELNSFSVAIFARLYKEVYDFREFEAAEEAQETRFYQLK